MATSHVNSVVFVKRKRAFLMSLVRLTIHLLLLSAIHFRPDLVRVQLGAFQDSLLASHLTRTSCCRL